MEWELISGTPWDPRWWDAAFLCCEYGEASGADPGSACYSVCCMVACVGKEGFTTFITLEVKIIRLILLYVDWTGLWALIEPSNSNHTGYSDVLDRILLCIQLDYGNSTPGKPRVRQKLNQLVI